MKKFLSKVILAATLVAALAIVPAAKAQLGNPTQVFNSANLATLNITNSIVAGTTNEFQCLKGKEVAIGINFALNGAGTSNLVVNIDKGLAGVGKWTTNFAILTIPATGTVEANFVTNLTVNAVTSLRFRVTANVDSTSLITNCIIRAVEK